MVVLGLILLIIGLVASIPVLLWLGVILIVVGLVLNLVPIGGTSRRVW
jgi:Zn-dependent membrane protease YugP